MNTEKSDGAHSFWVRLTDSVAAEWHSILGKNPGRWLPVSSPVTVRAELPGFDTDQHVYLLALDVIDPVVITKIAERLAEKFNLTPEEAQAELQTTGIPIWAAHVESVMVRRFQRWI